MLNIYKETAEQLMAIPVVTGRKSEKEKFAGAYATYTMEALMHDGKALQAGTSHNLGQHFTKAFEITYLDRGGELQNPYHTSWGVSTRLIGGIIMVHGDNRGLVLPPRLAPIQVIMIPIAQHKEGVLDKAYELKKVLGDDIRVEIDDNDNYSPGWKFNEYEMKGVPIRIEVGPKDIEKNQVMISRRDTLEKQAVPMEGLRETILALLDDIHNNMLERARNHRDDNTYLVSDFEDFKNKMEEKPGFAKGMWCGSRECEDNIKAETSATIRCMPFEQEDLGDKCHFCGKEAKHMVYVAKAY
jgi:prolyl-tRNA synthetase